MTQPAPVRRPAIGHPGIPLASPAAGPARPVRLGGNAAGPTGTRALTGARDGTETLDPGQPPPEHSSVPPPPPPVTPNPPPCPAARRAVRHRAAAGAPAGVPRRSAAPDCSPLECVGLGPGFPRRGKRHHHRRLRPVYGPTGHRGLRAKGSVHR